MATICNPSLSFHDLSVGSRRRRRRATRAPRRGEMREKDPRAISPALARTSTCLRWGGCEEAGRTIVFEKNGWMDCVGCVLLAGVLARHSQPGLL